MLPRCPAGLRCDARQVGLFLLHHRHEPLECGAAFTSFKGGESPLRHQPAITSCRNGGHGIWWAVDVATESAAFDLLPYFVLKRTTATRVAEVDIP